MATFDRVREQLHRLRPVPRGDRRLVRAVSGVALAAAIAGGWSAAAVARWQAPADPSPAIGDAEVVAQGVGLVPSGELAWRIVARSAPTPANLVPQSAALGFLVAGDGVLLIEDANGGVRTRLASGEAALTDAGEDQLRAALGPNAVGYFTLELVDAAVAADAGDGTLLFQSESFAGPGAAHDLDLVGDRLAAGEAGELPAGVLPTAVLVTAGALDVVTAEGDAVATLVQGEAVVVPGGLVLTAGGEGAAFVAAVVGPAVPSLAAPGAATPVVGSASTPFPVATPVDDAAEEPAAPTVTPEPAPDDADGDGLTDTDEAAINTDPTLLDSDGDGLSDGEEVTDSVTAPLAPDTDADGVLDGDEVTAGTDPNDGNSFPGADAPVEAPPPSADGDTDGDGFPDADEFTLGTDPNDIDTDDDDLTDGDELFIFATGPLNPDTDGDGVIDGIEITNGTDPNDPNSF